MKITFVTRTHQQINANYDTRPCLIHKTFEGEQKIYEIIDWLKSVRKNALGSDEVVLSENWEEK